MDHNWRSQHPNKTHSHRHSSGAVQDALLQAGELLARGQKGAEEVRKPGGSPWQQELPRERL